MKYKLTVLFCLFIGICSLNFVHAKEEDLTLFGKTIYVDPGHGGSDPGAIYGNIHEADINLLISMKLKELLEQRGATVFLTRYGDYDLSVPITNNRKRSDLSRRGNLINTSMCDLFVSIHLNADSSSTWKGAQAFYDDINPENEKFAKIMQEELKKSLKTTREYKELTDIYLFKRIERPGVLVEAGFLTNPNERYLLKTDDYQNKVALAVLNGIIEYLKTL